MVNRALARLAHSADVNGVDARFDRVGHNLADVRPLYEQPSDFDEAAFRHVRQNFQRLVNFFNELADVIGQSPLQLEGSSSLGTEPSVATFINHDWRPEARIVGGGNEDS